MSRTLVAPPSVFSAVVDHRSDDEYQYVSFLVDGQLLGVPVGVVQEVLTPQTIVPTPRGRPEIAGLLNLRGQVVTVLSLRRRLGLPDPPAGQPSMNVVIRHANETFSLLVDDVGDVIDVSRQRILPAPYTLDALWKSLIRGVYRLESRLFIVLNVSAVLKLK